jgi:DNA-binding MarR family transcriptional regulator
MTDLAALVERAEMRDSERGLLRAILPAGEVHGSVREIAERVGVSRRVMFRCLASLEADGIIIRSARPGRFGSVLVTFNGDAATKLHARCHRFGWKSEALRAVECNPIAPSDVERVKADRARYCYRTSSGPKWLRELGQQMETARAGGQG